MPSTEALACHRRPRVQQTRRSAPAGGDSASRDGLRWRPRPGPRVLAMTDTVAELNQVEIAMLCALTAGRQVRPPGRGRHPEPETQNRIDPVGELK